MMENVIGSGHEGFGNRYHPLGVNLQRPTKEELGNQPLPIDGGHVVTALRDANAYEQDLIKQGVSPIVAKELAEQKRQKLQEEYLSNSQLRAWARNHHSI